jgi:hypothetical protein
VNGKQEHDRSQEARCCCEIPHDRRIPSPHWRFVSPAYGIR